jgi:hypothetical protein
MLFFLVLFLISQQPYGSQTNTKMRHREPRKEKGNISTTRDKRVHERTRPDQYFERRIEIPRTRVGHCQTVKTLINEEALLLAKYLRNESDNRTPRIPVSRSDVIRVGGKRIRL